MLDQVQVEAALKIHWADYVNEYLQDWVDTPHISIYNGSDPNLSSEYFSFSDPDIFHHFWTILLKSW